MVELRGVSKRFGDLAAVRDVSLEVRRGEFLTLLGPSGCGKTTLLRLIGGFESPDGGRVILDSEDVTDLPPYRRNVNQVFQSYALFPHLTVIENIAFGLEMKRLPKREIRERSHRALELVSLQGKEGAKPAALSGGQRQRVALARAIVCEPKVLLLDEPLSALDAKLREQMQAELKHLQRRLGITFIFVTHDQQEALAMSDRVAVMNDGAIAQLGDAAEIYRRPLTRFVAGFIGQSNVATAGIIRRGPDSVVLKIAEGIELNAPAAAVPPDAKTVSISIRPERIRVSGTATPGANRFEARVVGEIFRGQTARLTLRTAGGFELSAVAASEARASLPAGDLVHCTIDPEDIVVVRDE